MKGPLVICGLDDQHAEDNANFKLNEVDKDHVQSSFDCIRGWRSHNLSGKSTPLFHHPHCEEHICRWPPKHRTKFLAVAVVT